MAVLAVGLLCAGCQSTRKPVGFATFPVELKIFRVHDVTDLVGSNGNVGCRLDNAEVGAVILGLQTNSATYGRGVRFTWDGIINNIDDPALKDKAPNDRDIAVGDTFLNQDWPPWVLETWDSGAINIYFTGNVYNGSSGVPADSCANTLLGGTVDPGALLHDFIDMPPFILVNDGGGNLGFGFCPSTPPASLIPNHVLEHEVTHYLSRFRNRTFGVGPTSRTYDSGEHAPAGSFNILKPTAPVPLIIPGAHSVANTELWEIWQNIRNGTWNQP